jgi:hypothetical protein
MLTLIPCLFFIASRDLYLREAERRLRSAEDMERDLRNGKSSYYLHQHYRPRDVVQQFEHLRELGIESFQNLATEKEILYYLEPIHASEINKRNEYWEATGPDPFLVYSLPQPRFVNAVLVRIEYLEGNEPNQFQVYWKNGDEEFVETRSFVTSVATDGGKKMVGVPVGSTIDTFRIDPMSRSGRFKISEIFLVVPQPN